MRKPGVFSRVSRWSARAMGHPVALVVAVGVVVGWALLGPLFGFSDTWQLTINTGTTIVTFLMVFLIQNTQNHQENAVQVKLDELIRAVKGAHNLFVQLEDASEEEVAALREHFRKLRECSERDVAAGKRDTDSPELEGSSPTGQ